MPNDDKADGGTVQSIVDNLGAFFRHLLPGVLVTGAACVAYPSWFSWVKTDLWQHILIVAAIALTAGNIWFAINRYSVKQFFDYLMYLRRIPGPARGERCFQYHHGLGAYVADSVCTAGIPDRARRHVTFRASSALLLYIVGETGRVFSVWHEPNTLFARHKWLIFGASAVIFAASIWQDVITRNIDHRIIEFGKKNKQPTT
jgi:hypothetical protein